MSRQCKVHGGNEWVGVIDAGVTPTISRACGHVGARITLMGLASAQRLGHVRTLASDRALSRILITTPPTKIVTYKLAVGLPNWRESCRRAIFSLARVIWKHGKRLWTAGRQVPHVQRLM